MSIHLHLDDSIILTISQTNDAPLIYITHICAVTPLTVKLLENPGTKLPSIKSDTPSALLSMDSGTIFFAKTKINKVDVRKKAIYIEFEETNWSRLERRRGKRIRTAIPSIITLFSEKDGANTKEQFDVLSVGFSTTGARIRTAEVLQVGWMVRLECMMPNGKKVTALAEIVRQAGMPSDNQQDYGLEFIELVGDSKTNLADFMQTQK